MDVEDAHDADYAPSEDEYDVIKMKSASVATSSTAGQASGGTTGGADGGDDAEADADADAEGAKAEGDGGSAPAREEFGADGESAPIKEMDRRIFEELLLVVQNLGAVDENDEFVRGEDCLMWLGDLQR